MHFDVCIIGSGPAGALVVNELAPSGARIGILEAGNWLDREARAQKLAAGTDGFLLGDTPDELRTPLSIVSNTNWSYFQTKKVGGNSLNWGGLSPRGLPSQFKMKSTYGVGDDWPFDYDLLEPYYCRAEEELGVSGDSTCPPRSRPYPLPPLPLDDLGRSFADACTQLGYRWELAPSARTSHAYRGRSACDFCHTLACMLCPTDARYASDTTHVQAAIQRSNVSLLTDTSVTSLVVREGRVRAVRCMRPDRSELVIEADRFVLAAGALESTRILLDSTSSEWPHGLGGDYVGRCFMGHTSMSFHGRVEPRVMAGGLAMSVVSREFEEGPHLATAGGFRIGFGGIDMSASEHGIALVREGLYGSRLKEELRRRVQHGVVCYAVLECTPQFDNRVTLDYEHRDALGRPGLSVNYVFGEREQASTRLAREAVHRIFAKLFGVVNREGAQDFAHQLGTTRMGDDPATSVVDRNLKMHAFENLYIVGGSVFPNALGPTNPTLTVAALALRLADHMRRA